MPTAPNSEEFERKLKQLLDLSQSLLSCEQEDIEAFSNLMAQREALLDWLNQMDVTQLDDAQQGVIKELIQEIQATDRLVAQRLNDIVAQQAAELKQISLSRKALAGYKFPYTTPSHGIENEG